MSNTTFDVIILGGGPAGLGSALHCAKKGISVLLLEQNKIGETQKTWLTFDYILNKYSLQECIRNRFSDIVFSCYLGSSYFFKDKKFMCPIYGERALALLAERARNEGALIRHEEPFLYYSFEGKNNDITITTSQHTYCAKLAVDAMGRKSEILRSNGLQNDILDMGCLAFFIKGVSHKNGNTMHLYDSYFPGSDYFWLVPLEDDKMMAGIFFFSPLTASNIKEKEEKLAFYMKARNISGEIYESKMGNIPLGGQTYVNANTFLCIGDSCNTALPSSGFSFHRCLEESEILANFIVRYLTHKVSITDYKKELLGPKIPAIEIHLMISDMLSKFTNPMLNKAIGNMNNLSEEFLVSFLTGKDMSINFSISALRAIVSTFSLAEIRSISLKQNYLKQLLNLYNLLPAVTSAKLKEQMMNVIKGVIKQDIETKN